MSSVPSSNVSITSLGRLFHTLIDLVVRRYFFFLQPNSPQNMKELRQQSNSLFFFLLPLSSTVSLGCRYVELLLNQIECLGRLCRKQLAQGLSQGLVKNWLPDRKQRMSQLGSYGVARVSFSHAFVSFLHKIISHFELEANCCSAKRRPKREGLFAIAGAVLEWEMEPVGLHCCPYPWSVGAYPVGSVVWVHHPLCVVGHL